MTFDVVLGDLEERSVAFAAPDPDPKAEPAQEAKEAFIDGVVVGELDDATRTALGLDESLEGVAVETVEADSAAAKAGLKVGQVITEVDQEKVTSVEEAFARRKAFEGELLYLQVYGDGRKDILVVRLK
jgi:serine protease Do